MWFAARWYRGCTPVLKHEEELLGACCLGNTGFGTCAFAGELAEDRAADDQRGSHQADGRHSLAQKEDGEGDSRKRLEVADDGDGLHGQFGDGAKVEQAAEPGVDDAERGDSAPIDAGGDAGGEKRGDALRDERENQRGYKGGTHLERGVLEPFDVRRPLAGNDHQRVAEGRGDAARDARDGHIAAEALCRNEESATGDGYEAGDFTAGQLFAKNERGEGHNDDGATVIQQRGDTDANGLVGAKQEYPAGTQRGAREDKGRGFAGTRRCLQLMALRSAMAAAMIPLEPNSSNAAKYVTNPLLFMHCRPLYIRACLLWGSGL